MDTKQWNNKVNGLLNGVFTYDHDWGRKDLTKGREYTGTFPGVSGDLSGSPEQYAMFLQALMGEKLISMKNIVNMQSQYVETGFPVEMVEGYGQGQWTFGKGRSHSQGIWGFFPWLDLSSPDEELHNFGIVAVNYNQQWNEAWAILGPLLGVLIVPFFVYFVFKCVQGERSREERHAMRIKSKQDKKKREAEEAKEYAKKEEEEAKAYAKKGEEVLDVV